MANIIIYPKIRSYRDLHIWQDSMNLVTEIYQVTKHFPKNEKFGLTSQIRRAAVSIPSNIAEGQARNSPKDFARFLSIAMGSLCEMETQLIIAQNLGFINANTIETLLDKADKIGAMTRNLQKKLN